MIPSVRQLREAGAHDATGNFAVPSDDGAPLAGWDLDGVEGLGPALAAQFALTGSSEIADPFGLAERRHQIAATADFDGNDWHSPGLTGSPADHGESSATMGIQPHSQRIGHPASEGWCFK
jgi:hypothetical protein